MARCPSRLKARNPRAGRRLYGHCYISKSAQLSFSGHHDLDACIASNQNIYRLPGGLESSPAATDGFRHWESSGPCSACLLSWSNRCRRVLPACWESEPKSTSTAASTSRRQGTGRDRPAAMALRHSNVRAHHSSAAQRKASSCGAREEELSLESCVRVGGAGDLFG